MSIADLFVEKLLEADISFAASLPDDWLLDLIRAVDASPRIKHIAVAREEEIPGLCAGAFFAGKNSIAIMGMAGMLAIPHELATLNLMHGIPLLIATSHRGRLGDARVYQVTQGQVGVPVIEALGIPYYEINSPSGFAVIPEALEHSRLAKRPVVLGLQRSAIRPEEREAAKRGAVNART